MFKIENENEEKVIKTIRLSKELNKKIEIESKNNNVSASRFITLAILYALDHMEEEKEM